jgi:hypothetical protein
LVRGECEDTRRTAKRPRLIPTDLDIDGAANLDELGRMTLALMNASILKTITPEDGNAKLRRINKRMNGLEQDFLAITKAA